MKIRVITHTDLDGAVCALLGSVTWDELEIIYCNYKSVDDVVKEAVKNNDSEIYITDICPSESVCKIIDENEKKFPNRIFLFDHHKSKSFVKDYDWAKFDEDKCGAELFYEFLIKKRIDVKLYWGFVQIAKVRDTWQTSHYLWDLSNDLSTLLIALGRDRFIRRFRSQPIPQLGKLETAICQIKTEENERYVKSSQYYEYEIGKEKYFVVFGDKLPSEIGHYILSQEKGPIVSVVSLRHAKVELRSLGNIDVGQLAKQFHPNGGGHVKAGGFPLTDDKIKRILDIIFER